MNTGGEQVTTAIGLVLDALAAVRKRLVGDLTAAASSGDYDSVGNINTSLRRINGLQNGMLGVKREWEDILVSFPAIINRPESTAMVAEAIPILEQITNTDSQPVPRPLVESRLPQGSKTPQKDYERPILETLVEMGGLGRMRDVLARVERKMQNDLNAFDREPIPSNKNEPRWRNTAQWCRNRMVHEHGYLRSDSPHGTWEITESGRTYLQELQRGR